MTNPRPESHRRARRDLLDIPDVAKYICSSIRHVRRLVAERRIPRYNVGHFVRFDPDEIDQWLDDNQRGPDRRRPVA